MVSLTPGGEIVHVGGVAARAGLRPGDRLLAVDGHILRDVIDFRFYADAPSASMRLRRGGSEWTLRLSRPPGADWGIEFREALFDGVRRCRNRCLFCFLDQLPPGWRRSLYLRDDDYRLSFLYGNFVTLTNLRPDDWERLAEQHLSPLYVSVHATEPQLRRWLLGRPRAPDILEQLVRLKSLGIAVHAQVVLCPGLNDGPHLERTLGDLAALSDTVLSVGLVPVGLTRFRCPAPAHLDGVAPLRPYTPDEAAALLAWAGPRQRAFRRELGRAFLYLADEFYLLAGRPVPAARNYDGFPQLENGIGLVRRLLDDWARTRRRLPRLGPRSITLACGTLIAPLLRRLADELVAARPDLQIQVVPVPNSTFGPTVTVSGLLTGEVLRQGLRGRIQGDILFLPAVAFDADGRTLDGATLDELAADLGRPIVPVERMGQVVWALQKASPSREASPQEGDDSGLWQAAQGNS